jgi:hypothetical protein
MQMKRHATTFAAVAHRSRPGLSRLLAATVSVAFLSLSAVSVAQTFDEVDSWGEYAAIAFEENYPASDTADAGLSLELPSGYFAEVSFPPMADFGVDELPLLVAGLDPTETP